MKLVRKNLQRQRLKNRLLLGSCILLSTSAMFFVWLVYFSHDSTNTQASTTESSESYGVELEHSEVITEFTWEYGTPLKATLGADAIGVDNNAHTSTGGRANTHGLAAGADSKGINLMLAATPAFNSKGIDISIDFKPSIKDLKNLNGGFFTRGKTFDFGVKNGFLSVLFTINGKNGVEKISETTQYELALDGVFRTYRFIFSPTTCKAELFVNNVAVWSKQCGEGSKLMWNENENIIIGKRMTAMTDEAIMDNLIIRVANETSELSASLYNFNVEAFANFIRLHWNYTLTEHFDYFTVERSFNGTDYEKLGTINRNALPENEEYSYEDKPTTSPIVFYRIRQTFPDGRILTHPASAIKIKAAKTS